jgi:putative membrane protein
MPLHRRHDPSTIWELPPIGVVVQATRTANGAVVESSQSFQNVDRRNELAANRTVFAAERTYAAWIRTGLAALASGIGAKPLLSGVVPQWTIGGAGTILIL